MARPSKYETHVAPRLNEIKSWARDGATEEEIAKKLKISRDSLSVYKKSFSAFSDALKSARAYDDEVVDALHQNTLGGKVQLLTPIKCKKRFYENGKLVREEEVIEITTREEYVRPDTLAQMYWLNNRQAAKWKAKPVEQADAQEREQRDKDKDELLERLRARKIEGFNDDDEV